MAFAELSRTSSPQIQIALFPSRVPATPDVFIDRATGRYELTETRMGFFAVMNDLHKGRDSGKAWAVLCYLAYVAWVP